MAPDELRANLAQMAAAAADHHRPDATTLETDRFAEEE